MLQNSGLFQLCVTGLTTKDNVGWQAHFLLFWKLWIIIIVMKTFDKLSVSVIVGGPLSILPLWKEFYQKRKKKSGAYKNERGGSHRLHTSLDLENLIQK